MVRSAFVLVLLFANVATAHASRYTLKALLELVSKESPSVVAARATLAMRRAQLFEQQLRWLPDGEARFFLSTSPYVRCLESSNLTFGASQGAEPNERLSHCTDTNVVDLTRGQPGWSRSPFQAPTGNFTAQLRQPLYTSGKIRSAIGAAQGGVATEEANVATAVGDISVSAVQTFAQLKAARAAVAAIETALGTLRGWVAKVEKEIDGPNPSHFTESDRLRLRVQLENAQLALIDQERVAQANLDALRALTGDPEADVDESEIDFEKRPIPDASEFVELMRHDRPEVRYGEAGLYYYRYWRRLQARFTMPDLGLVTYAGWGYSPGMDIPSLAYANLPPASAGANFVAALHEGLDIGQKLARWRQVGLEERMQQARFKLGLIYWTFEVEKAWLDYREAAQRLSDTTHAEHLTQGWYAAVDENLAIGAATDGRELVEVMFSWMTFRLQRLNALKDAMVTLATLRRLSGQPILGPDGGLP